MKNYYISFFLGLLSFGVFAQNYEFGIVHVSDYSFKVVAIPDFDSTGDTDVSDAGFTIMMPAGNADITYRTDLLGGRSWGNSVLNAAILENYGGDGTEDAFFINLLSGQTIFSHTMNQQIDLVRFEVSNMPVTGQMRFLLNSKPIAINALGGLDSFYNSNIDATTKQDYFGGIASGLGSFDFATLSTEDNIFLNSVSVFPNPASEFIYIRSSIEIEQIKMFDVLGKQVLTSLETEQLKVDHLQSGIYFLKVFGNNGSATKKIVIK